MADAEEDFSKLSIEDKINHKLWKARVAGFEELSKEFAKLDPDTEQGEFRRWAAYVPKMIKDANLVAFEAGIGCALSYITYAPDGERLRDELIPTVVQKGLGASRSGTKAKSVELLLMLVEIDVGEPVIDLIIAELGSKQPKVVAGCVSILKDIVENYGAKAINIKAILKKLSFMFGHNDKNVRAEANNLTIAIYPWIGKAIDTYISDIKPVQIKELNEKFETLPPGKPKPLKLLRSQQAIEEPEPMEIDEEGGEEEEKNSLNEPPEDIDPYEFADPVDITSKIPENLYTELESKKWKERKEVLDLLEPVVNVMKLSNNGPYGELIGALSKHINDTNVVVGITAVNCITHIAKGLRNSFAAFKPTVLPLLLEKLKEKKQTFVDALRACLDAVFNSVAFIDVLDDILAVLPHKNPQVKAESVRYLIRILKTIKTAPTKGEVKRLCEALLKSYSDGDTAVREAAAEALGTLMKTTSEATVTPFIESLDSIKLTKVKDYFDKAEVQVKAAPPKKVLAPVKANPKKPALASAKKLPAKAKPPAAAAPPAKAAPPSKVAKPATAVKKAPTASGSAPKKAAVGKSSGGDDVIKYKFGSDDIDDKIGEIIPESILEGLQSSAWKLRLEAIDNLLAQIEATEDGDIEPELVVRQFGKKPGWKEVNFQVISKMYLILKLMAEKFSNFTKGCAVLSIQSLVDKLGDIKLKKPAGDCLDAYASKFSLRFVLNQINPLIVELKSPKIQGDALVWYKQSLIDFGISGLQLRSVIDFVLKPLGSSNATVRSNAVKILAELRVFVGPDVRTFVQDVNPNLLSIIDAEFAKVANRVAEEPTKFQQEAQSKASGGDTGGSSKPNKSEEEMLEDLFPRVDISPQVNSNLLGQLNNSNWKIRKEGLDSVVQILEASNKRIKPTIGELLPALKARLDDANKNLGVQALEICGAVATAMGKPFEKVGKVIVGPICKSINDTKALNRAAAVNTLSLMVDAASLGFMVTSMAASLTPESPYLRKDLLKWISEKLPEIKTKLPDLTPFLTPVMLCLSDKNSDVRKYALICLGLVIENTGYNTAKDKTKELKGNAQTTALQALDNFKAVQKKSSSISPKPMQQQASTNSPKPMQQQASSTGSPKPMHHQTPSPQIHSPLVEEASLKRQPLIPRQDSEIREFSRNVVAPKSNIPQPPVLTSNYTLKEHRLSKERLNRWIFDIPPPDLMQSVADDAHPHLSDEMFRLMFSLDIYRDRDYISALGMLAQYLEGSSFILEEINLGHNELRRRYFSVSDLIFKYVTLRLFEEGSTIVLKCIGLLELIFKWMESDSVPLHEVEAFVLLPTLISRLGHSNLDIRNKFRNLIKQVCIIYPASKVFNFLLDYGLNSSDPTTRSETLSELGGFIQRYGINIGGPPANILSIMANYVSDENDIVKVAAVEALKQAYSLIGDQIFNYLRRISDEVRQVLETSFNSGSQRIHPIARESNSALFNRASNGNLATVSNEVNLTTNRSNNINRNPAFSILSFGSTDVEQGYHNVVDLLNSREPASIHEGFRELEKLMTGQTDLLVPYIHDLLLLISHVFSDLFIRTDLDQTSSEFNSVIRVLVLSYLRMFSTVVLANSIGPVALARTMEEILTKLLNQKAQEYKEAQDLYKSLNLLMVKILDITRPNVTYQALFLLFDECLNKDYFELKQSYPDTYVADDHVRYCRLVMKCAWKITRGAGPSALQGDLDTAQLLYDMNEFFKKHSPSSILDRVDRKDPVAEGLHKTLKTVLYELCSHLGDNVLNYRTLLRLGTSEDFVSHYLTNMLEKLSGETQPLRRPHFSPSAASDHHDSEQELLLQMHQLLDKFLVEDVPPIAVRELQQFTLTHRSIKKQISQEIHSRGHDFFTKVQTLLLQAPPFSTDQDQQLELINSNSNLSYSPPKKPKMDLHDHPQPQPSLDNQPTINDLRSRLAELNLANQTPLPEF